MYGDGNETNASSRSICVLEDGAADLEAMVCQLIAKRKEGRVVAEIPIFPSETPPEWDLTLIGEYW